MAAKLTGKVVSVNDHGDLVTDIPVSDLLLAPTDESITIRCDGHATTCLFPAEHGQPEMTFIALQGRSGFLELSLVGESATKFLGIHPGADVSVRW